MAAAKDAASNGAGGDDPVVIKKYANRRLYNTARSSYVTLDHLAAMVREGQDFIVRDAKSGDDITRSVLTQIIFEEETKGASMLPTNFLRRIISLYGDSLQSVVPGYLEASMETFTRNQEQMREHATRLFGAAPAIEKFEAMTRQNMELFSQAMRMFSPFPQEIGGARKAEPGEDSAPSSSASGELGALKDQLAQMQAQLDKLARKS
ncbi:polyhydroxyalkanoate synthesis repressor PhaR [Pikeienuella piscinae]|uniref:Polyhydroxyalkanoate synthesis repressor PhaR n=1 Tax=Pikeienuella piscinae TaxID=2748098 RepID=A0A7L5BVQ4_9RHOB|nr:polyhydroxyalkanoate synthesis repressor PhaR [Pikeienuella piscinae]QIE55842.1 polyhydroxyalkanoate synthesis repressor PhaR [Pikeienuella piscinae]